MSNPTITSLLDTWAETAKKHADATKELAQKSPMDKNMSARLAANVELHKHSSEAHRNLQKFVDSCHAYKEAAERHFLVLWDPTTEPLNIC